jgi:hypothetical protein
MIKKLYLLIIAFLAIQYQIIFSIKEEEKKSSHKTEFTENKITAFLKKLFHFLTFYIFYKQNPTEEKKAQLIIDYKELKKIFNEINANDANPEIKNAFDILKKLLDSDFFTNNITLEKFNEILGIDSDADPEIQTQETTFLLSLNTINASDLKSKELLEKAPLLEALITPHINQQPHNSVQRLYFNKFDNQSENISGIKTEINNFLKDVKSTEIMYSKLPKNRELNKETEDDKNLNDPNLRYKLALFNEINLRINNAKNINVVDPLITNFISSKNHFYTKESFNPK